MTVFTKEYLSVHDVQDLIDRVTGYGIDNYSRKELAALPLEALGKHIVTSPQTRRLIKAYNQSKNAHQYRVDTELRLNPKTRETRPSVHYERTGVMLMLEEKSIQQELATYFHAATTLVNGVYLPTVLCDMHPIANPEPEVLWL